MKRSEAFPSNWLGKDDVASPLTLTIKDVDQQMVKGDNGDERKTVMHFSDGEKSLILNNVNWQACEDAYGEDSDDWRGKRIEVYVDPSVMFGGKRVGGVRLRVPQNGNAAAPAAATGVGANGRAAARAAFDAKVKAYNEENTGEAYKPGEADDVYRKVMAALFPGRTPASLTAAEWAQATEAFTNEFSAATRDLVPF